MNSYEMRKQAEIVFGELLDLLKKKNNDYAEDDNCFSNFEYCADKADISVDNVFMVFLAVKLARLKELLSGKETKNESIIDTLKDMANYAVLFSLYLNNKGGK